MKDNDIISQNLVEALKALSTEVHFLANLMLTFFLVFILLSFYAIYLYEKREKETGREGYFKIDVASELYEQAKYEELMEYCEKTLKKYKNNINAMWYLALVNYQIKDYSKANALFQNVIQINPGWREDVNIYLNEMDNESEPQNTSSH